MSQSGQDSREVPSRSVPGRVRSAPSWRTSFWSVHVRTRMRSLLLEGRVVRTSLRFRYNSWFRRNGEWRRAVVSAAGKTSTNSKHVPSCVLFALQKIVIRGRLLILSDNLALVLALCTGPSSNIYIAFSHASYPCVWFPGPALS